MTFKAIMALSQLQTEQRSTTTIDGHKILLLWHQEKVYAIQSQCPHLKLPLAKGTITEQCSIVCPFHKSEFDLTTGETKCWSTWPPLVGPLLGKVSKQKELKVYATKVEDGQIYVKIDD